MKRIFLVILFCLLAFDNSFALISDIGFDPLDQTGSTRPAGMGSAFTGLSDDLNCLFYNPAGLGSAKGVVVSGKALKDYSLALGYETSAGNIAIGLVSRSYGSFKYNSIKTEYENSLALIGYGIKVGRMSIGISTKMLQSQRLTIVGKPDISSSSGSDSDIGALYKITDFLSVGIVGHNVLGSKYNVIGSTDEAFPKSLRTGIAIDILGKNSMIYDETYGIKIAYDADNRDFEEKQRQNTFYGMEASYNDQYFLRAGASSVFFNGKNVDSSSFGLGYKNRDTQFDIASWKDPVSGGQVSSVAISYFPPKFEFFRPVVVPTEETRKKELLTVILPSDEFITYSEWVSVEGWADPKANVLVNGVYVYVDKDGRFRAAQTLTAGKNLIEIEGIREEEKIIVKRKVLRRAKVVIAEEEGLNKKIVDEVLKKEAAIMKREQELKKAKAKGINVAAKEKLLAKEKENYEAKKADLYAEKSRMDERKQKVESLATLGVLEVSPDKKFEIEAPIKRGEMVTWLVKSAGLPVTKPEQPVFADVPANHRYAPFLKAALDAGLLIKPSDNKFRPDDPVTEEEGQLFFKSFGLIK